MEIWPLLLIYGIIPQVNMRYNGEAILHIPNEISIVARFPTASGAGYENMRIF